MTAPVFIVLTEQGAALARRLVDAVPDAVIHGRAGRVADADPPFTDTVAHLRRLFADHHPMVAVCAAGIVIRALGPVLTNKQDEPPVLVLAEDGSTVVPLLGGHRGANALARVIAAAIGIEPAITTAGDLALGVALDEPPAGYELANPRDVKGFTQALMAGSPVTVSGEAHWLANATVNRSADAALSIVVSDRHEAPGPERLVFHSQTLAVGIGAERGADPGEVVALARTTLEQAGLAEESVALVASLDLKEDERAIHAVTSMLRRPARFFTADRLEAETPRLANPSDIVYRAVGCHGVAEGAALAAAGPDSVLVVPKQRGARATCAVARAPNLILPETVGRARGRLSMIGLGPGDASARTAEAGERIASAEDVVGYSLYLDLAGPLRPHQTRHDFALGEETARVDHALTLAAQGRDVALVSSGDPGIFAMAALVFERIEFGPAGWGRVEVTVVPGVSAMQVAAARIGAPLGHDFCVISLSDLMTPPDVIEQRLAAAAAGDFAVALYNPASRRRRALLPRAREILLRHRPGTTPVIIASNLGREGERVELCTLDSFDPDRVDMLTIVLIGSSTSRTVARGDGEQWVYTPRGYAAKAAEGDAA